MSAQIPDPIAATQAALAGAADPESAGSYTLPTIADAQTAVGEVAGAARDVALGWQRTWNDTWNAPWAFASGVRDTGADAVEGVGDAVRDGIKVFALANVFAVGVAALVLGAGAVLLYRPPKALKRYL